MITKSPVQAPEPSSSGGPIPLDVSITARGRTIPFSAVIILLSTAAFIPLLAPLFESGPPINADIGVHASVAACLKETGQWLLPTAWCAHGQAGLARLSRYAVLNQYITRVLDTVLSVDLSFKIVMVLYFFLLPVNAYLLLRWIGYPLAGAMAYAFFLFEPGGKLWGGYAVTFTTGGFMNIGAAGMSPLTILTVLWFLSSPGKARAALAAGVGGLHFLMHPGAFLWLPIPLGVIAVLHRREILECKRLIALSAGLFLLLISFWLFPAIATAQYFTAPGIGASMVSQTAIAINLIRLSTAQLRFLVFGVLSTAAMLVLLGKWSDCKNRRVVLLIALIPFLIALAWVVEYAWPGFFYFRYFMIDRSAYELRTFLILNSMLLLFGMVPQRFLRHGAKPIGAGIIFSLLFLGPFFMTEKGLSGDIFTSEYAEPNLSRAFATFDQASGRILAENTYVVSTGVFAVSQLWSLSGYFSGKEFLGNGDFWYTKDDYSLFYSGSLFYRNLSNYTDMELLDLFNRLNVQFIWVFSSEAEDRFKQLLPEAVGLGQYKGVVIYEVPLDHSFLSFPAGAISNAGYEKIRASAVAESEEGGILFFKVRQWPNWKAWIDGNPAMIRKGALGLMELDVPPGTHDVRFAYGLRWWDLAGYMLTALGMIITGWILIAHNTFPAAKNPKP